MSIPQYGDYQYEIYFDGLEGRLPKYPVDFASLERAAGEVLPAFVHSYVAGGCGDEGTQRANVMRSPALRLSRECSSVRPNVTCRCRCSR
ncbi:MAG: lactate 2-monooxygenase [Mycobacterium sp.]|jgi:hypothetical protein|nr:lactate 2-monooxygenase [Mycobacterium sp.]